MTESDLQTTKKIVLTQALNKSQKSKAPDADKLPLSSLVPECVRIFWRERKKAETVASGAVGGR